MHPGSRGLRIPARCRVLQVLWPQHRHDTNLRCKKVCYTCHVRDDVVFGRWKIAGNRQARPQSVQNIAHLPQKKSLKHISHKFCLKYSELLITGVLIISQRLYQQVKCILRNKSISFISMEEMHHRLGFSHYCIASCVE